MADDWKIGSDRRRRTTDQLLGFREANDGNVEWDTEAPADFTYVYHPDRVLVRSADSEDFRRGLQGLGVLEADHRLEPDDADLLDGSLHRYTLPARRNGERIHEILDRLESEQGVERGRFSPDHWVHVSPGGGGSLCPAIEPQETGLKEAWPPYVPQDKAKHDVRVAVVDTGWHPPAATHPATPWLEGVDGEDEHNGPDLPPYAGHGTFVAGVVRCQAPHAQVYVEGFPVNGGQGGGILESDLVKALVKVVKKHDPQVINLSAGCRTRLDLPPIAMELFHLLHIEGHDRVLVAAAGNDSTSAPFWPAAFDWAVGVGSLDRDERVSDYSNFGVSADVYALGRNHVNAFPDGTFVCRETPDKGDVRVFSTGLARWSGTSFSSPVVAGLIAREISLTGCSAAQARSTVLARAVYDSDPAVGPIQVLRQPFA